MALVKPTSIDSSNSTEVVDAQFTWGKTDDWAVLEMSSVDRGVLFAASPDQENPERTVRRSPVSVWDL